MKLSKSKLALAKVINENGGWPQDSEWAVQNGEHGRISFSINKPVLHDSKSWMAKGGFNFKIEFCKPLKNWHQNVLSREEYHQAYPKADADVWIEWKGGECPVDAGATIDIKLGCGDTHIGTDTDWDWADTKLTPITHYRLHKPSLDALPVDDAEPTSAPPTKATIEQLAADYRSKLDFASRKQQEADEAKAAADAALGELERAGDALGLLIGIAKPDPEPELVITDWRDLQVGDEIECVGYGHPHTIGVVERFDEISVDQNIFVRHQNGDVSWPRLWRFIRRP